ncbi:hypothetical protein BGX38DRAFT_1096443 [Terfezia claveryi]|nr:hypothetical protein BGX38DRAFT_1096443 [Terfezia claveryi]
MVCRHGCLLWYLNIYTRERARHGIALLQSLLKDLPSGTKIRSCYDISCIFATTVKAALKLASVLTYPVGRFHMYAHEYKCHVLYNTQCLMGWGNMIGEECESDWLLKGHLVASTRVSSAPRRR